MSVTQPTAAQLDYIDLLCRKLGVTRDAAAQAAGVALPLAIDTASAVIGFLKNELDVAETKAGKEPTSRRDKASPAGRREGQGDAKLSAKELRAIAGGKMPAPDALSEDENWVLFRLAKLTDLEHAIGEPVRWPGVNGGGPIRVEQLVQYFGSIEAVATAFGVSVGTVRNGWSGVVPANRAHEAAWLTRGYVQPGK